MEGIEARPVPGEPLVLPLSSSLFGWDELAWDGGAGCECGGAVVEGSEFSIADQQVPRIAALFF